jgi:Tol biopolymer transport system component
VALVTSAALGLLDDKGVAQAEFPGSSGRIYFSGYRHATRLASYGIFSVAPNGKGLQRVTRGRDGVGSVNPFGTELAFQRYRGGLNRIFTVGLPKGQPHEVANSSKLWTGDLIPRFSGPEGRRIVYVSHAPDGHTGQIWVMRADGTHRRQLTHRHTDSEPTFTPDGKTIVFVRAPRNLGDHYEIFRMRSDGSHVRQLTSYRSNSSEWPDVSPNGKLIVFERSLRVYTMRINGHHQRPITPNPATHSGLCQGASFSPNGRKLVYACSGRRRPWHLVISKLDGSRRHSIGRAGLHPGGAIWAPAQ